MKIIIMLFKCAFYLKRLLKFSLIYENLYIRTLKKTQNNLFSEYMSKFIKFFSKQVEWLNFFSFKK